MTEMASLWGYEKEDGDMDEVGQQLLYATLELEKFKSETAEEMSKNKEYVKQLTHLLKCAIQERDEARTQLHKLINSSTKSEPIFKANSSVTESNSLSGSPVDSLFDAVSPSELSNVNLGTHHFVAPFQNSYDFCWTPKLDRGSLMIDNLTKGRVLPQKGMLLQAVRQAGPLLQTLMVAGPLPRWRNPPQMQPFHIPPIMIKGGDVGISTISDFGNVNYGANYVSLISSAVSNNGYFRLPKRQKFCLN